MESIRCDVLPVVFTDCVSTYSSIVSYCKCDFQCTRTFCYISSRFCLCIVGFGPDLFSVVGTLFIVRKLHGTRGAIASGNIHSRNLPCPVHGSPYYHFVFEGFEYLCYLPQTDESIVYGNNENQIDGANVSSYRENFLHLIERLVSSHVDPFLVCRVCSASSFLQATLLAMRQGTMLVFLTCAISKGYLRADEKLEDLTEERKKELRGVEMRDRRLTVVINKGMVPPGQDIHSMTKAEQDTLLNWNLRTVARRPLIPLVSGRFSHKPDRTYIICLSRSGAQR